MKIDHLSDNELIDYVIKHDNDPIRVRLATHMQRIAGAIIDDLERAGMDDTWCNFRSVVNDGEYLPGQYISHLENEIEFLNRELQDTQDKLAERETMSVSDLIEELKHAAHSAERRAESYLQRAREADQERETMRSKMKVWRAISTDMSK